MRPNIPFFVSNISVEFGSELVQLEQRLVGLGHYATPDLSSYARNRLRLWLGPEPDLGGRLPPKPGYPLSVKRSNCWSGWWVTLIFVLSLGLIQLTILELLLMVMLDMLTGLVAG